MVIKSLIIPFHMLHASFLLYSLFLFDNSKKNLIKTYSSGFDLGFFRFIIRNNL